jgi:FkbM family methyltransferase
MSRLRYLAWRAAGLAYPLTVSLRSGPRLVIRSTPTGDLSVAYEIFVEEQYRSPRALDSSVVKRIVDVGANVGYSLSYFAESFPSAVILAFEPSPVHLTQIDKNLSANALEQRVQVIRAAAGTTAGQGFLIDAGEASRVVDEPAKGRIAVPIVDFFCTIGEGAVDLLKLDCEGAEFDLLMDTRFEKLDVRTLVLECHANRERPHADAAIVERLAALGFTLENGTEHELGDNRFGMLWAYRW